MTDAGWEALSDQAIGIAGVIYFLALLAHLVEWTASLRGATRERAAVAEPALVGAGAEAGPLDTSDDSASVLPTDESRTAFWARLGVLLTGLGAVIHLVALVGRGMAADPNRVPWGNMYEFTISASFFVILGYLGLRSRFKLDWMAPLVVGFVLTVLMAAVLVLHEPVSPLTEALNSYWLVIHVVAAVIATSAFTLGGILSIVYLLKSRGGVERTSGAWARVPSLDSLDRVSYRIHAFAFPMWTFGVLIAGPIWAHEAWAAYWSWDPKEVWSFITWVVYAGYLHARTTAGWKGRNAAILAIVGLVTLWINFIGINYFSDNSQHSYAAPVVSTR